jgi:hypothetical protein
LYAIALKDKGQHKLVRALAKTRIYQVIAEQGKNFVEMYEESG